MRNNFTENDQAQVKLAVNILSSISERTTEHDLKKAILKYLLHFHLVKKSYVSALQNAKDLYVSSTENYDTEESIYAVRSILHNLALLKHKKVKVINKRGNHDFHNAYTLSLIMQA